MTELSHHTATGDVSILYFDKDHRAAKTVSAKPLESADVAAIVARAHDLAEQQHLLLPDADTLLERCVIALLTGHLILQGPPGTGKTTLAHVLAAAFNATAHLETATADWSTYDVIGGLHPSAKHGMETLEPWLGHVPRAALQCASVIARHDDPAENEPHQAHWLIIDEFNRAEIDKAIGPLYTILGGGGPDEPLPLWFADDEVRDVVWLPHRFRIIATMNTVDTNYVYSFSQGLTRRFQFVYVGVPAVSQVSDELHQARTAAAAWFLGTYGEGAEPAAIAAIVAHQLLEQATTLLKSFLEAVRYDDASSDRPGWPVGTAQIVDVYRQLVLQMPSSPGISAAGPSAPSHSAADALHRALDLALADRVIPQASNLLSVQLDAIGAWLDTQPSLRRSAEALQHLRAASSTGY
jgi:MoxR-like ATPase